MDDDTPFDRTQGGGLDGDRDDARPTGGLLAPHILDLMRTPAEARADAIVYLRISFMAVPFMYFFAFAQMAQRGAGDSTTPFWFMALAVALDVVLNPLLILGIGPFPR